MRINNASSVGLVALLLVSMVIVIGSSPWDGIPDDPTPAQAIWVDPKNTTCFDSGDTFIVDILINITDPDGTGPATGLFGFEYKLKWNSTGLESKSIQYHRPWIYTYEVRNETGSGLPEAPEGFDYHWLALTTTSPPGETFVGVTSLCTYTFLVLNDGNYTLDIYDVELVDDEATLIPHTTVDGYVTMPNFCVIRADGSVFPPTAPISSVDNITYTLTGNITKSIVVERDNIVVDGAGCTVKGTGTGTGITLSGRSNVTIKNVRIELFGYGVRLSHSSSVNIVSGNNITDNYYGVYLNSSSVNIVSGNNITRSNHGILLYESSNYNNISGNTATSNEYGIHLYEFSNHNNISGNNITSNWYGIRLYGLSNYNSISGNNLTDNYYGINLHGFSDYNNVSGNNIMINGYGISLYGSSNNRIYHNNVMDNIEQVSSYDSTNIWDNGYPSGGNYWSNYVGEDMYYGSDQDQRGSDGIGDSPSVIDANNIDNYPFMYRDGWGPIRRVTVDARGQKYNLIVESNATITHMVATENILHFEVTGPIDQTASVNITIPVGLNTTAIKVFVNGVKLEPPPFPIVTTNGTHYFVYFEVTLSTHTITIQYAITDIAVTSVAPLKTVVGQGFTIPINVTVQNQGNYTETFNVTVYANATAVQTLNVTNLPPGNSTTITFTWNTTGFAKGNYTISANATTVSGETDTADNICIDGTVRVNMVGDVAPEYGLVDIVDVVYVAIHFGSEQGKPPPPDTQPYEPNADINGDGIIDIVDIVIIAIHFGEIDP